MPDLSEDQKTALHEWAAEGATLNDIQKRLKTDFDIGITYMETRFLASDLELQLRDPVAEAKAKEAAKAEAEAKAKAEAEAAAPDIDASDPMPSPGGSGEVSVTTDSITQPGTVMSGTVTFSDSKKARWYLDQTGQLGFDPDEPGYRPSEPDAIAFQEKLHEVLQAAR